MTASRQHAYRTKRLHAYCARGLRQFEARHFHEKWFLAIRRRSERDVVAGDMIGFRLLAAPRGRSFADPFIETLGGRHYLFFEDWAFKAPRGRILYCEIDSSGTMLEVALALEETHHVAYPFVFLGRDGVYLLPEMAEVGRLQLYRADVFPGAFVFDRVLIEPVRAVDPTIHWADRGCWLFANDLVEGGTSLDHLNIFWASSPHGPWTPHPQNPVLRDASGARPAGALFERAGDLVRPAQDCSVRYGDSVVFKRVLRLDRDGFEETEIGRISPGWLRGNLGTHTYNRDSRFEVVDGRWLTSERWWLDLAVRLVSRALHGPGYSEIRDLRSWLSHSKASRTILAALRKALRTPGRRGRSARLRARWRR